MTAGRPTKEAWISSDEEPRTRKAPTTGDIPADVWDKVWGEDDSEDEDGPAFEVWSLSEVEVAKRLPGPMCYIPPGGRPIKVELPMDSRRAFAAHMREWDAVKEMMDVVPVVSNRPASTSKGSPSRKSWVLSPIKALRNSFGRKTKVEPWNEEQ
uniref:Uncharacterized protein n=1 Tax=Alexandrium catenella TaxID=2925 RepID=A0A7S1MB55_ALECA|mmetsp:Transcript_23490/g.63919  ORF Transcript_23490/g.63919 Transcript_23490/m.63919 type:complete len:154 (+) Transcript_23490:3-464(+)